MTAAAPKKENLILNLACNLAIPTFVLMQLSKDKWLGPQWGMAAALVFPLGYGIYDLIQRKKTNIFSVVGVLSVLLPLVSAMDGPSALLGLLRDHTGPAGMELGMRLRGYTNGMFEWLRKAPWGDPGFSSLVLSVVVFGFVGGITGVTIGTEQINIIVHNTLRSPGHFHATVVSGTAMAFMGATYYLLPLVFQKRVALWPLAKIQPYIFAGGMFIFTISMTAAGYFGVPRRHWDITFAGAPYSVPFNPIVDFLLALVALGGVIAATGAFIFVAIAVKSVFFGEPLGRRRFDADLLPQVHKAFSDDGTPNDEAWGRRADKFLDEFEWYARAMKRERETPCTRGACDAKSAGPA